MQYHNQLPKKINSLANLIAAVARLAVENIVNIQLIISVN